jgi:NAD(P)-dependent dehydrogenase (short-subunit alcohol dehydrogenase family)
VGRALPRGERRAASLSRPRPLVDHDRQHRPGNYAASKSGLFGFTKTLAREAAFALGTADKLSRDGIGLTVNAVTPGLIETDMTAPCPRR